MTNVAVVGLGIMGRGMAANLAANGHEVAVWNRTPGRVPGLAEAASPAQAAAGAEVVFEVTADDASSRQVWFGAEGILAGVRPGTVVISSATLSVGWVAELAAACAERGLTFFDMPVTGGAEGARTGNLVMLVGGDPGRLTELDGVLRAIARQVRHFGPVGAGTRFKLVLNALQAVHFAAFGEALKMAVAAGLDPRQVGEALVERPGGVVTGLAWNSLLTPPEPINFSAEWARKDLAYAQRMAGEGGHPILDAVLSIFSRAVEEGHGKDDWSVVNRQDGVPVA
ncbi:NAD(P)-dependent oxidoreductase [Sphaerisporangium fuscum]|uniref:NAD(P)-dependent oxidoreductase n=1 Tax=Sphaerisporangium fuscum TaxID=2835868 RepID=UPI001BDD3680|nr:NAD(P)-dependent oxidoreductase [Sphaerisporangium fuscum]